MKTLTFDGPRAIQDWLEEVFADGAHFVMGGGTSVHTAQPMVDGVGSKGFTLQAQTLAQDKMLNLDVQEVVQEHPDTVEGLVEPRSKRYRLKTEHGVILITDDLSRPASLAAQQEKRDAADFYRFETHFPGEQA